MNQIINLNFDEYVCVTLKLVSGEEIVTHVDKDDYENVDDPILILHDPRLISIDGGSIILTVWILTNADHEYVIDKNDILIRSVPDNHFEMVYNKTILKCYENEDDSDSDFDDDEKEQFLFGGNDSIN